MFGFHLFEMSWRRLNYGFDEPVSHGIILENHLSNITFAQQYAHGTS
jgi:hypothetical protein